MIGSLGEKNIELIKAEFWKMSFIASNDSFETVIQV